MALKTEIIPAILVDSFEEFEQRIRDCEEFAESVQWDVMDGEFVPHTTFSEIAALNDLDTTLIVEAHLMVAQPEEMFESLSDAGIDRVIVHVEAVHDVKTLVKVMRGYDFEVGLAINPETDIDVIAPVANDIDEVMVMTVEPGASGQSFMQEPLQKVRALREKYPQLNIGVDGGINRESLERAQAAGANRFAINSAIFASPDPAGAFEQLQSAL